MVNAVEVSTVSISGAMIPMPPLALKVMVAVVPVVVVVGGVVTGAVGVTEADGAE
jgi:hypothetical protein